jgi:hypothetical protein
MKSNGLRPEIYAAKVNNEPREQFNDFQNTFQVSRNVATKM